jgi:hypothetical protein
MGLQLLCDFDTELEMLAHKIFKLFGPLLLSLAVYLHLVIVPDYLLNRLPVEHDDLRYIVGFLTDFDPLVLQGLDLLQLAFLEFLAAHACLAFGIELLLLLLALEVLLHPHHFLDKELLVRLARGLLILFWICQLHTCLLPQVLQLRRDL